MRKNSPSSPYQLDFFTRSHTKECGQYKMLYEATFSLYGEGSQRDMNNPQIIINEARQTKRVEYYHSALLRNYNRNLVKLLFEGNNLLSAQRAFRLDKNKYEIKNYTRIDDQLAYVVKAKVEKGGYHSEHDIFHLYIDMESYAILKIEWEIIDTGKTWTATPSSDSTWVIPTTHKKTWQFVEYNEKYYPKYVSTLFRGKIYYNGTNEEFCDSEFHTEMIVDKIHTENIGHPKGKTMDMDASHELQLKPYNATFWENYDLIKEFPVSQEITDDLSKKVDLKTQFEQSFSEMGEYKSQISL